MRYASVRQILHCHSAARLEFLYSGSEGRPHKVKMLALELGIITVLIVVNGLLAMSELAIVSSRPARLSALVEKGASGSRRALALASDPGKFLSTVQIG